MSKHFQNEIGRLKSRIVALGNLVQSRVANAIQSFKERDAMLAREVIEGDRKIDRLEVDAEEECLKILALYHPVAIDLRFIVAVLKMNNDLERIGDLAANIARRTEMLCSCEKAILPPQLDAVAEKVQWMLRESLGSLIYMKAATAHAVMTADAEVDELHRKVYHWTASTLKESPETTDATLLGLSVSRNLERIGDLACNIAEDVVYMLEGEIVRHHLRGWPER
jgi:phosphate transport system protein